MIEIPPFAEGCFPEMPAEQYHAIEAVSSGGAKKLRRSPLHYKLFRTTPNEPTAAMQFGTAVHTGVLEPERFAQVVTVLPELNRYTKDGKAAYASFLEANAGKIILSVDDFRRAIACTAAVRQHKGARYLLDGGTMELSLFWVDGQYKVPCKCRFDCINRGGGVDLKTTQDASPDGFGKAVANFEYNAQGAHYLSGAEHVLNESPKFFAFIAVESEPPHAVACYHLTGPDIRAGQHLMSIALERYAKILENGQYPGYPDTLEPLKMPRWAHRFSE